ncbi:MAG: TonB-dependent receptor [Opitutaceae bacterium]|nr:TonB-dependent receptor [Opitutaceae bacterium]
MKRLHRLAAFTGAIVALLIGHSLTGATAPTTPAASASPTGSISGRVQNVVTGQSLNNARVTVKGTDIVAFTDDSGTYRLSGVPAGPIVLEVFFTGLDPQQIPLTLGAGQAVERDVNLTSVANYGATDPGTVKLDPFTVSSARETNASAIAINEQRFAANIKNVVSADALGDVMDGNVGEFLKFMPGITAEYDRESGGSVASVSVRGFPTNLAVVSSDGLQMANTSNPQGSSRVFQFTQVSINNISRIEVTKVPTPATAADSMGGSVDMIGKSAFERKNAQLRYSVSFSGNHRSASLEKEPHTTDEMVYKVLPSFNFDYTLPVTKNFGLVVTGQSYNRFIEMWWMPRGFNAAGTATGASFSNPHLRTFQLASVPRTNARNSVGLKADWRLHRSGVLSLSLERGRFTSDRSNVSIGFDTGNNGNPNPATGQRMTFGEDFTNGATGRGSVTLMGTGAGAYQQLDTTGTTLRYRFDDGNWRVTSALGWSNSEGGYQDTDKGRFRGMNITLRTPVRVTLADYDARRPQTIRVFDNNNREVDFYNLDNYVVNTGTSQQRYIRDGIKNAKVDVRKSLGFLSFPAALQGGGLHRIHIRDIRRDSTDRAYFGPDGNAATQDSPALFAMRNYVNQEENFGFRNMPWVSTRNAWRAYQENPALFGQTPAQLVASELFRLNNSERMQEAVSAGYLQTELGLLRNKLKVLGGVRYERTAAKGEGVLYDPNAVFLRNASGAYVRTPSGDRIRRPEAGAVGSLEELRLTRQERGFHASRTYDGYYPSVHLTYHLRENLLARAAYAKTYGRPDFSSVIPNATIDETDFGGGDPDPTQIPGRINIRNTGLKPWSADNYDLSLEYYTEQGGLFSVGAFRKDIRDFFGNSVRIATATDLEALGLDPRFEGWMLTTRFNLPGSARVSGFEFNLRQSLRPLGGWGKYFSAFVNGTKLDLDGDQDAEFGGFITKSANWGFDFSRKPFAFMAKWNHRGRQRRGNVPALGLDAYEYGKERTRLDINVDYQLRPNLFLYVSGQNIFDVPEVLLRYGSLTPGYAHTTQTLTTGVQWTLGVKGSF